MRGRTIFGSYCRYYGRYYYRIMTVVTTVVTAIAMENRLTTYAIFFLIYGCAMLGIVLKKKSRLQSDDDNDNDNDKVYATLPGTKEQQAKNDDEQAFSRIRRRRCDSRNISGASGVLLHRWNTSKPHVSRAVGTCSDDSSGEMQM